MMRVGVYSELAVTNGDRTILTANPKRRYLKISNPAVNTVDIAFGRTTTNLQSFALPLNVASQDFRYEDFGNVLGLDIHSFASGGAGFIAAIEGIDTDETVDMQYDRPGAMKKRRGAYSEVAVALTDQTVVPPNPHRRYLKIVNPGVNKGWIAFGKVSVANQSWLVMNGVNSQDFCFEDMGELVGHEVRGQISTAAGFFAVIEGFDS